MPNPIAGKGGPLFTEVQSSVNTIISSLKTYTRTESGRERATLHTLRAKVVAALKDNQTKISTFTTNKNTIPQARVQISSRVSLRTKDDLADHMAEMRQTRAQLTVSLTKDIEDANKQIPVQQNLLKAIDETLAELPYGWCELARKSAYVAGTVVAAGLAIAWKAGLVTMMSGTLPTNTVDLPKPAVNVTAS